MAGIVIGRSNLPLVHRGEALFNIASVEEADAVEKSLEALELSDFSDRLEFDEIL
jgi:hypothetical protein